MGDEEKIKKVEKPLKPKKVKVNEAYVKEKVRQQVKRSF